MANKQTWLIATASVGFLTFLLCSILFVGGRIISHGKRLSAIERHIPGFVELDSVMASLLFDGKAKVRLMRHNRCYEAVVRAWETTTTWQQVSCK